VNALSNSQRLCGRLDLIAPWALAPSTRLVDHPELRLVYPEFRIMCYSISRGYDVLLRAVLDRARDLAVLDPVAAAVAHYLPEYIEEEADEDHLADLEVLGYKRAEVEARTASARVAALVGSQYFWSLQVHPVAVLGAIQVAEGYSPPVETIEELIARSGYPRTAFAALFEHAERDIEHRAHLHRVMDDLELSRSLESLISLSAFQALSLLGEAMNEILQQSETARPYSKPSAAAHS
jgi:hypothetical protein